MEGLVFGEQSFPIEYGVGGEKKTPEQNVAGTEKSQLPCGVYSRAAFIAIFLTTAVNFNMA